MGGAMKTLYAVIAIIVAIAVTASVATLLVLPSLQPPYAKFDVVALDFAFDKVGFNPELHVKAHQIVWIVLSNQGTNPHEFLLFNKSRDFIQRATEEDLNKSLADHPNFATNDTAKAAALDEYDSLHDSDDRLVRYNDVDFDVQPGESRNVLFIIDVPGTYFFACHQVDTTTTPWMVHQSKGMWGTLVVEG